MAFNLHTLLFKTTRQCNLECDYCYTRRFGMDQCQGPIPFNVLSRSIEDYSLLANEGRGTGPDGRTMVFLWHGGEPCLAGMDFFGKALELQAQAGSPDLIINSLTTNGTLLNAEWVGFLSRNKFRVSISLDGPGRFHDLHRVTHHGWPTFGKVMEGIKALNDGSLPFGILCVVSEENALEAKALFDFYVSHGLKRLAFLPRMTAGSWLSAEKYANFMTEIYDCWIGHDDPGVSIREFENIVHELLGGRAELCEYNGCCGSYLAIDCSGDVYLCDLFMGDERMRIGNVLRGSLKDMLDSPATLAKVNRKDQIHQDCRDCGSLSVCKAGCLYRRSLPRGRQSDKDIYCTARKQIISHVNESLADIIRRSGYC